MNVRHNDDDRPNPAGAAAAAERGGGHDAPHRERRWIAAGQTLPALNKLISGSARHFQDGEGGFP